MVSLAEGMCIESSQPVVGVGTMTWYTSHRRMELSSTWEDGVSGHAEGSPLPASYRTTRTVSVLTSGGARMAMTMNFK